MSHHSKLVEAYNTCLSQAPTDENDLYNHDDPCLQAALLINHLAAHAAGTNPKEIVNFDLDDLPPEQIEALNKALEGTEFTQAMESLAGDCDQILPQDIPGLWTKIVKSWSPLTGADHQDLSFLP